jgi:hypothetical protein
LHARVVGGGDHDEVIHRLAATGLDEQRSVEHHHGRLDVVAELGEADRLQPLCEHPHDLGVGDLVEEGKLLCVGEDDVGELLAIDARAFRQHIAAEVLDDARPGAASGLDDVAGDLIGVDEHRAALFEEPGDDAFASTDPAGQTDEEQRLTPFLLAAGCAA